MAVKYKISKNSRDNKNNSSTVLIIIDTVFNIYLELTVNEALEKIHEDVKIRGRCVKVIEFTDDRLLILDSPRGLIKIMQPVYPSNVD